jgi:hypothetical protein
MQISMAAMPAACLRLLPFSLCGDAMGRSASAMKVRGASQPAFQKVRMKVRGAAQPAAKAKAKVKKCSKPRCRNDAASPRAKFCIGCFKENARCTGSRTGGNSGAKGVIGNSGNSSAKGFMGNSGNSSAKGFMGNSGNSSAKGFRGNRGNTSSGQKKKFASKRSALRRSTKMLLVVKNPWLALILAGKKVWEIRGAATKVRGKIHLALSGGGGRIVGQCHITHSFAIDKGVLGKHVAKHCVKDLGMITYRRPHVWVLSKARRYKTPFEYSHPRGAINWVKL